jgi:hypothetical protein
MTHWRLELHRLDGTLGTAGYDGGVRPFSRGMIVEELLDGDSKTRWEVLEVHVDEERARMVWKQLP